MGAGRALGAVLPEHRGADFEYHRYLMDYRQLGDSGIEVSTISLGSWLTYGGAVDDDNAKACVQRALDLGITLIDTANAYATGGAESFLGDVLADVPRDSYVLATKLFFPMSATDKGLSAAQVRKQLDASLQRLKVDHIDLYQCHRYDTEVPLEETMGALTEAVETGKVRAIGFSEWAPAQIQAAIDMPGVTRFSSSQPMYNALFRRPEKKVIPLCAANGIGQIVFSPLAQGVLTGKYLPGQAPPADSRLADDDMNGTMGFLVTDPILEAVQRLQAVADEAGLTMAQLALAWILREPNVSSAIIGASRPSQVDDNAAAAGVVLDDDTLKAIDDALGDAVS
jgi:aryl-alcohol dehydrogenase-like predicted oxidoreductase